jgi:hypothetical protein
MEVIFIALIMSGSLPIMHICLIQLIGKSDIGVRIMFVCFLLYAGLWGSVSLVFNNSEPLTVSQFIGGISTVIFLCLGYMEAFSMICRGFSFRIITDIYLNKALSLNEVITKYGDGKGMDWMIRKRIDSIEKLKMVSSNENCIKLESFFGRLIGWSGIYFKKIMKMGAGG